MLKNPCDLRVIPAEGDRDAAAAVAARQPGSARRVARAGYRPGVSAYRRGWPECRTGAATPLAARTAWATGVGQPAESRLQPAAEHGSQTTEYALLLIVAATITMLAVTWAKQGAIKGLLDGVVAQVLALFGIGAG